MTTEGEDIAPRASVSDFDPHRLSGFLRDRLGFDGPVSLDRIAGGQSNPTYFVTFPGRRLVLRKRPSGATLRSAHAIDREYRVLKALEETEVPVPRAVLYHDDSNIVGTPFYLMERLEGRVFHDCALPGLLPSERRAIYLDVAATLAKLHAVDPAVVGLGDYGRPGNYFERQIQRWSRQWANSPTKGIPELDRLVDWLLAHLPPDDGKITISHGDYRLGNLVIHPSEPRVVGVLDWELSTLGHPLADLGFACMPWRTAPDEYSGVLGLNRFSLGLPEEGEFIAHYMKAGKPIGALLPFHVAFGLFRFAVIFVGIADRARTGTAAGHNAAQVSHLAQNFAQRALETAQDA